jgi:hypothetical protein
MEKNLKAVFSADKMYKINIIREVLEENNIQSVILDQKGSALLIGEIALYVNEKDEAKALKIIADHNI